MSGRRRIPSLNWLRVFEAAAQAENFARAARRFREWLLEQARTPGREPDRN